MMARIEAMMDASHQKMMAMMDAWLGETKTSPESKEYMIGLKCQCNQLIY
jgi:hypothetical protein